MRWTLFFLAVSLISIASASPTLSFQNEKIQPGETILGIINTSGEFVKEISKEDIKFFKDRKEIFFESNIVFYNRTFYFYAYTLNEGNFSVKISNILYKESNELKSQTVEKNFEVKKEEFFDEVKNQTVYKIISVKPGFISTSSINKQKITVSNKEDTAINLTYAKNEITLLPYESKEITLIPLAKFSYLNISTYKEFKIPIIFSSANSSIKFEEDTSLKASIERLTLNLTVDKKRVEGIYLFNFADEVLTNFSISSNLDLIKASDVKEIPPKGMENLTLTFSPENPGHFEGFLEINYLQGEKNSTLKILLDLFVLPKGSAGEDFKVSSQTCTERNGSVCKVIEKCDREPTFTKGGEYCCLGTCVEEKIKEKGSYGWLIGSLILLILIGIGYMIYKKSKKTTKIKPEQRLRETSEKYSKRLKGELSKN